MTNGCWPNNNTRHPSTGLGVGQCTGPCEAFVQGFHHQAPVSSYAASWHLQIPFTPFSIRMPPPTSLILSALRALFSKNISWPKSSVRPDLCVHVCMCKRGFHYTCPLFESPPNQTECRVHAGYVHPHTLTRTPYMIHHDLTMCVSAVASTINWSAAMNK